MQSALSAFGATSSANAARPADRLCNRLFAAAMIVQTRRQRDRAVDARLRHRYKRAPAVSNDPSMPHHKSAEKRLRQTEKRTVINRARLSRVRTFVKKVETAIETGDKVVAQSAFQLAQPELHRATTKGVMHKNTVARKLSRLAARINAL